MIKKNKKGMIVSKIFIYILSALIIVMIVIFGMRALLSISEKQRTVLLIALEEETKSLIDRVADKIGTVENVKISVHSDVDEVCFIDLSKADVIMEKTTLPAKYPLIRNIIEEGATDNAFVISGEEVIETYDAGDVCIDSYPHYSCVKAKNQVLDVLAEGKGDCTSIVASLILIDLRNEKNETLYEDNPIIVMREDAVGETVTNWREILSLMPISAWNDEGGGIEKYSYVVYYAPGAREDEIAENIEKLKDLYYAADVIELFGEFTSSQFQDDYGDYWVTVNDTVVVDYQHRDAALIASLFASYLIAPLYFIDDNNFADFEGLLKGKRIFVVDYEEFDDDPAVTTFLENPLNVEEIVPYSAEQLREDWTLNPYRTLASSTFSEAGLPE